MTETPRADQTNGIQAGDNQVRSRYANGNGSPSNHNREELAPLPLPLPQQRRMVKRILMYAASGLVVIAFLSLCVHIQREYYMNQLLKYAPSPSPFQNPKQEHPLGKQSAGDEEPTPEVLSMNYEPPSEALQKIPFLRKTEDEIYADQMRSVLGTLKQAVHRLDRGTNETQLAGVITMRAKQKEVNEVNVNSLDDLDTDELISKDTEADETKVVKDLVKRLASALSDVSSSPDPPVSPATSAEVSPTPPEREPDPSGEDPVAEILAYRSKYSARDRELAKMIAGDNVTRDPKFGPEVDKREELRRQLIMKLIDQFFDTETDDDARIEKAYHYAMPEADKLERYARLEAEIFGPTDLVSGGPDVIYGDYRRKMGYAYDDHLQTFIKSSDVQRLKKLEGRERKAFYAEMKILLQLEKRIKEKVVKAAEGRRSEL